MTFGSECSELPLVEQREWEDVTTPNVSRVCLVDECLKLTTTWLRSRRVRMYKFRGRRQRLSGLGMLTRGA
jgi:hypothetical protein